MNLANKYRPKTWDDVTEQGVVVQLLKAICETKPLELRNFLLIGPAGTGKTTLLKCMARVLNNGQGEPIELDAASHSGVETVRDIMQQARAYPVGCEYKIFIIDECFPGNTWISTPAGKIQIKDIQPGDLIYNMTGQATVTQVFKNRVKPENLISISVGGRRLVTTQDHLFFTNDGWIPAKYLQQGDQLYDSTSLQTMRQNVRGALCQRSESAVQQGVSCDLYAQRNVESSSWFDTEKVSNMWKGVLDTAEREFNHVLTTVWRSLESAESKFGTIIGGTFKTLAYVYLSSLWEADGDSKQRSTNSLLSEMCESSDSDAKTNCETCHNSCVRLVWKFICSELFQSEQEDMFQYLSLCIDNQLQHRKAQPTGIRTYETTQSDEQSRCSSEDDPDARAKWYFTYAACCTWWERTLHQAADAAQISARTSMEIRVLRDCGYRSKKQSKSLSFEIRTRPSISRNISRNRGGWCRSQYEIASVVGCKESAMSKQFRVDSVEIYQRGNNEELFRSCFKDSELHSKYVTMYDLEISGHPSYFANELLVHNCHAFSNAAWQSMLTTIESPPAKSIFMFATTNPEKIPATILSRVQVFQLSKISLDGIYKRLQHVIECENAEGHNITYDPAALNFIAKLASGGMRDALTLLDKALVYSTDLTSENVAAALNLPNYDDYFALLSAYAKRDNKAIASILHYVYNSGVNFVKWFEGFHSFLMNVVKYILLKDIEHTMIPSHYSDKISKYSDPHLTICLKLATVLLKLNSELKFSQYQQEVALTYLCQPVKKEVN